MAKQKQEPRTGLLFLSILQAATCLEGVSLIPPIVFGFFQQLDRLSLRLRAPAGEESSLTLRRPALPLARPGGNATGFAQFEFSLSGKGWSC